MGTLTGGNGFTMKPINIGREILLNQQKFKTSRQQSCIRTVPKEVTKHTHLQWPRTTWIGLWSGLSASVQRSVIPKRRWRQCYWRIISSGPFTFNFGHSHLPVGIYGQGLICSVIITASSLTNHCQELRARKAAMEGHHNGSAAERLWLLWDIPDATERMAEEIR